MTSDAPIWYRPNGSRLISQYSFISVSVVLLLIEAAHAYNMYSVYCHALVISFEFTTVRECPKQDAYSGSFKSLIRTFISLFVIRAVSLYSHGSKSSNSNPILPIL